MGAALACVLAAAGVSGCKTTGAYVWVDDLPAAPRAPAHNYVIQVGDTIGIRVWNQDSISTRVKVRPDGKVSVPFVNDIEAAGSTPSDLAARIQARLQDYIVSPVVTVVLEDARPMTVAVIGEVSRPGNYQVDAGAGVLQALATAGGMTPFADRDRIMVIREKPDGSGVQRIRFTYSALTTVQGRAATFRLHAGDVVVVE